MMNIATVGLDLVKNAFQVHAIDADWAVVIRRQDRRAQMLSLFARLPHCPSAWKPEPGRITGYGTWRNSSKRCR